MLHTGKLDGPSAFGPPTGADGFFGAQKKPLTWFWTSGIKWVPLDRSKEPRPCLSSSLATPLKILRKFSTGGQGNSSSNGPVESAQENNLDPKTRGFNLGFFGSFLCPIIYTNAYKSTLLNILKCCNRLTRRPEIAAFGRFFAQIHGGALWNASNARNKAFHATAATLADVPNMHGGGVAYATAQVSPGPKSAQDVKTESPSPAVNTSPTTPKSSPIIKVSSTSRHTARNFCARESTYYTRLWTAWVRGPKEFWKRSRGTSRSTTKKKRLNGRTMETMREMDVLCPWCDGWVETIIDPNGGPLVRAAHLLKGTKGKKVQLCFGSSTRVES